jgi:hypothetical protein
VLVTIIGCWPESGERFAEVFDVPEPDVAEQVMNDRAEHNDTLFFTAGVVAGTPDSEDLYTNFIDPYDDRNQDDGLLERPIAELLATEWTVFGIAWDPEHPDSFTEPVGQRWSATVMADSAFSAEDVAQSLVADDDGVLWVCGVLRGSWGRLDPHPFVDPDL